MLTIAIISLVILAVLIFLVSFVIHDSKVEEQIDELAIKQAAEVYGLKKRIEKLEVNLKREFIR